MLQLTSDNPLSFSIQRQHGLCCQRLGVPYCMTLIKNKPQPMNSLQWTLTLQWQWIHSAFNYRNINMRDKSNIPTSLSCTHDCDFMSVHRNKIKGCKDMHQIILSGAQCPLQFVAHSKLSWGATLMPLSGCAMDRAGTKQWGWVKTLLRFLPVCGPKFIAFHLDRQTGQYEKGSIWPTLCPRKNVHFLFFK